MSIQSPFLQNPQILEIIWAQRIMQINFSLQFTIINKVGMFNSAKTDGKQRKLTHYINSLALN